MFLQKSISTYQDMRLKFIKIYQNMLDILTFNLFYSFHFSQLEVHIVPDAAVFIILIPDLVLGKTSIMLFLHEEI